MNKNYVIAAVAIAIIVLLFVWHKRQNEKFLKAIYEKKPVTTPGSIAKPAVIIETPQQQVADVSDEVTNVTNQQQTPVSENNN